MPPPLILHGGDIWTLARPPRPCRVAALLVRDGRIAAAGSAAEVRAAAGPRYDDLDLRGDTILPAFVDPHLHLLAWAASRLAVDCSPSAAPSIPALLAAIARRAAVTPPGQWIRACGYRETELAERRHPTRWELDAAAPRNPVRLDHASGHATVLNSAAMHAVGLTTETEEPEGAEIGRRLTDGEPNGLLLEMGGWLDGRVPPLAESDLQQGIAEVARTLQAAGIVAVQDLGARNDRQMLATLRRFERADLLPVRVSAAIGYEAFLHGERPGTGRLVKLVINDLGEKPLPPLERLTHACHAIAAAGCRIAVHCVTEAAVAHALAAFAALPPHLRRRHPPHRLEHAAICPPALAAEAARLGLCAVMNPVFIATDGDRYVREVRPESLPWLHNPATLIAAGVPVAAASDAPVATPDPLAGIAAMVRRQTPSGATVPGLTTCLEYAVAAHTAFAALAAGLRAGRLVPGSRADLVRLPRGWDQAEHCAARPRPRTMRAGEWWTG